MSGNRIQPPGGSGGGGGTSVATDPIWTAKGQLAAATGAAAAQALAVGTNGQTLIADSSAAAGVSWFGRGHPRMGAGTFGWPTHLSFPTAGSTFGYTAGRAHYFPILIEGPVQITAACCEVTTLAAGLMRLGVYRAAVASNIIYPTTLVADFGTVDTSTIGVKSITGLSVDLTPGLYCLVWLPEASPTLRIVSHQFFDNAQMANSGSSNVANVVAAVYQTQAFGALPGTFPAGPPTFSVTASSGFGLWAAMWLSWT